jgi:DNA-binding IclR family transcriptional regulator
MRDLNMESVRSVDRAIEILNSFTLDNPTQTIEQIMKNTQLARATVYRFLYTLERQGVVRYDAERVQYRLGFSFIHYNNLIMSTLDIVNEAAGILTDLHGKTKQTVQMCLIEETQLLYVFKREIQTGLKFSTPIGERRPLLFGALGRVALAFQSEKTVDQLLALPIPAETPYTVTDTVIIREELKKIRSLKLCTDREQTTLGVTAIASPIFHSDGKVQAVIGMVCPSVQVTNQHLEEYQALLLQAAKTISAKLGYLGFTVN